MKPTIFIGSSSEALPLAQAIQVVLSEHFLPDLWNEKLFELGEDTLNNLLRFVQCYDFAVLVLTDDDLTTTKKGSTSSPRDNIILELGLFMGALGRRRAFEVVAQTVDGHPKLPSDLLGNTGVFLPAGLHKSLDPAILKKELSQLISTLDIRSKESNLQLLPSTGLAIGYFQNFVSPVCRELAARDIVNINGNDVDISQDNFDFTVVLPKTLSDASIEGAKKFVKIHKIQQFVLSTAARPFPFYVNAELQDGRVIFYDYPTTLGASHEAIKIALAGPFLSYGSHHIILDNKEIRNFERTLSILLQDPSAAEFRDNVKIIQLT